MKDNIVLSLFDHSLNMVKPWAENGYTCYAADIKHEQNSQKLGLIPTLSDGGIVKYGVDINNWLPPRAEYKMVFAFPPCTNLAVSGARWFKDKGLTGLTEAVRNVETARKIAEWSGAPWMIENPISTLSTYWREPDYIFHPYEYDGYTDEDNQYSKKTCLWTSEDFVMSDKAPAEEFDDRIHKMPPGEGRSEKRSRTPEGFARAVFEANR